MQVVGERRLPDDAPPQPSLQTMMNQATTTTANFQQEYQHRAAWKASVMGAFNVLAVLLAVRLIVLISVVGGIFLTYLALQSPDPYRLGALGLYCLGVLIPAVYLAVSGRA
jgi:uncharacterized BrkB/YihY/UPF0761 family membrane protein